MKYIRQQNPDVDSIVGMSAIVEVPDSNSESGMYLDSLVQFPISLTIETKAIEGSQEFVVEQDSQGAVYPAIFDGPCNGERGIEITLSVVTDPGDPTLLRLHWKTESSVEGPFSIQIPAYDELEIADDFIYGSADKESLDQIKEYYDETSDVAAIFALRDAIRSWIPISANFQLLNTAARFSNEIKSGLSSEKTEEFLAIQLVNHGDRGNFDIPSMTQLEQIISTCGSLRYIPEVNKYNILVRTVSMIHWGGNMDQFWELEQRFDIAQQNWGSLLWDEQMTAFLARSLLAGDFSRVRNIISNWVGPLVDADSIKEEIQDAEDQEGNEAIKSWRSLLRKAATVSDRDLIFVSCRYFDEFLNVVGIGNISLYINEQIYEALADLREGLGQSSRARTAKHNFHQSKGLRQRSEGNLERACEEFENSLESALQEASERGSIQFTAPEWSLFWLFTTRSEIAKEEQDFEAAVTAIAKGQEVINSLAEVNSEETREYCISRLEATRHEILGDQMLSKGQLETANQSYGKAIHEFKSIDIDERSSYLIRRRCLITASLAEQRGDFEEAKSAHEKAAAHAETETFKSFNEARAEICGAKGAIIDLDWDKTKRLIEKHLKRQNVAGVEARHLNLLLEVLESFEAGTVLDIAEVFDRLDELRDVGKVADEFPFEYGHEYRPAFANILAAQRLQKLDVDPVLLNELIEISLRDVMAPDQAQQTIEEWGIQDIGLKGRWKFNFPTHIVRRYQEIEADEVGTRDNYADRGLALLRLLEQTLEFIADYYGTQEFGTDWQGQYSRNEEGRLSFDALRNFLNTDAVADCVWTDRVCSLLDEPLIESETVIDARNSIGHDRKSRITEEKYLEVKDRVNTIFAMMSSESPILGEIESEHELGAYIFNPHWENVQKWCYLRVDEELDKNTIYYLPPKSLLGESVVHIEPDDIIECTAERVLDNLRSYMEIA